MDDSDDIDNNDSGDDKVIADITTGDGGTCAGLATAGTVTGDDDAGGEAATADETLLLFSDYAYYSSIHGYSLLHARVIVQFLCVKLCAVLYGGTPPCEDSQANICHFEQSHTHETF